MAEQALRRNRRSTKKRGIQTDATVLAELVKRGFTVLIPFGQIERFDLVVYRNRRFIRVQCKTGRLRRGVVVFNAYSISQNRRIVRRLSYRGEIDVFAVYCAKIDKLYWVPVNAVNSTQGALRIKPSANKQIKRIRWAKDFELPG